MNYKFHISNNQSDVELPEGVLLGSFKELSERFKHVYRDVFDLLIDSSSDGFLLFIPAGVKLSEPVHIDYFADKPRVNLQNLVIVEAGSALEMVISCRSATHITSETVIYQAENSRVKTIHIFADASSINNRVTVKLAGIEAEHAAYGLALTKLSEHVGNDVKIIHSSPNCRSNQMFKHILSDASTGAFNGRVVVEKNSQKTVAYQRSTNILLDPRAKINVCPHLEIYADDVKCSHGATVGQLDAEALFYLRSRGIGEDEAKKLLLQAFASEIINEISSETLKNNMLNFINQKY